MLKIKDARFRKEPQGPSWQHEVCTYDTYVLCNIVGTIVPYVSCIQCYRIQHILLLLLHVSSCTKYVRKFL